MSNARKYKRLKSSPKQIEAYNKIQNRYVNMFNKFSMQPLEVLDEMKGNKMSETDRNAFNEAYNIVKRAKLIKDNEDAAKQ